MKTYDIEFNFEVQGTLVPYFRSRTSTFSVYCKTKLEAINIVLFWVNNGLSSYEFERNGIDIHEFMVGCSCYYYVRLAKIISCKARKEVKHYDHE